MDIYVTIQQMIEAYAEKAPHHTAVIAEDSSYTYRELNQKANQLAHYVQKTQLKQDSIIAISIDRSPHLLIGMLGILKAGCAYIPLDAEQPKQRLQYILEDTQAPVLITESKSKDKFLDYTGRIIFIDQDTHEIDLQSQDNPCHPVHADQLAYVIYTSGSTGNPKGVLVEHKSVLNYIKWFKEYSQSQQQYRIDFSSNAIFDMAVTTTITALALGLQVVICSDEVKKNVRLYLLHLHKNKINIAKLTPSYFKVLIQEVQNHSLGLPDLTSIILGGEILMTKDCKAWLEIYPNHILFNEYGPTESTVAVTEYKITSKNVSTLEKIIPIGKPGFNIDCMLINDDKQIETAGETGELYVGGTCLARGYLNQNALTSKQFINKSFPNNESKSYKRFYKTGDLCRYLPDGNLEFIKRIDNQVKIRGYRIEPGEIEACLASHAQIKDASIQARETSSGEKQLIGYFIAMNSDHSPSNNELREYLQQRLAEYMVPAAFMMMNEFPLTKNGKLDTKAFPDTIVEQNIVHPRTPLERQLVEIWQKLFNHQKIGVNSHFFELGGHSLTAARMIGEIQKSLSKMLQLKDLYYAPTIGELAIKVDAAERFEDDTTRKKVILKDTHNIPLGDFQLMFWLANLVDPKIKTINVISRKRLLGKLDMATLKDAFIRTFKKHEVLSYQISKFSPVQYVKNDLTFHIVESDLTNYTEIETENKLNASLKELNTLNVRQSQTPSLAVRLFRLKNEISELQVSVSHFLFDDASEAMLFNEVSSAYIDAQNNPPSSSHSGINQYRDYVAYERNHLNQNLERDISFWEEYLQDTSLAILPETEIVPNMGGEAYSTYLDMTDDVSDNIHRLCTKNSLNMTDLLCAAVGLTLKKSAPKLNDKVFINIIRSLRDNEAYDKMIGCFLRLDPVKVNVNTHLPLIEFAKSIQLSRMGTEAYQACSGMVKLGCLEKNFRKKIFLNTLARIFCTLYSKLFSKLKLDPKMLMMYARLSSLRTKQQFLININLLNNFVSSENNQTLFGLKIEEVNINKYDLSNIDSVLDICILRNANQNKTYLVISGNLKASFRQQIGEEIINLLTVAK